MYSFYSFYHIIGHSLQIIVAENIVKERNDKITRKIFYVSKISNQYLYIMNPIFTEKDPRLNGVMQ